jgi:hypothetical protein
MTNTIKLNAEKRNSIGNEFEKHFRNNNSKAKVDYLLSLNKFNDNKQKLFDLAYKVVRQHHPQEDVDTIKSMNRKYGSSGGDIYNDKCFNFETEVIDDEGKSNTRDIHIDFGLDLDLACAYYDNELREKNLDPDNEHKYKGNTNPKYFVMKDDIKKYLGYMSSNDSNEMGTIKDDWNNKYMIEVIGSSYCGSRQFKVDNETFEVLNQFNILKQKVIDSHERFYDYIKSKMDKVRLGLKSYRTFDQAKELADKLGIPLNESILDTSSSMALSIYSPENLAELLKDNDAEDNKADIIAQFKLGKLNQAIN